MSPAIMRGWWAVTLIQRFGGALNANIHFHMLFLDGAYIDSYQLKTPYTDGTTHILFEPLDFMYRMYGMLRAQEALERPSPGWSPWYPNPESI